MKRIIPFLILIICFTALIPAARSSKTANAETVGVYAVAAEHDVWFYSEANEDKGLFILPFSYYVKVLSDGDPFCRVEYLENADVFQKVTGYCRKSDLTFVDFTPVRPYLYYTLSLTYTIDGNASVSSGALNTIERTVSFYGTYYAGTALYYYVYADGEFGYVPALKEISYDFNTDYLSTTMVEGETPEPVSSGGLNGLQIAIICVVCAAAAVVAVLVLRGKKPPVPRSEESSDF